jgi:hypothetical protein
MDAPEELVEAVAEALGDADPENDNAEMHELYEDQARAVLAVPAIADALARDAKVAEIVERGAVGGWGPLAVTACLSDLGDIAALYPEAGK